MNRRPVVVLISGRGSNLRALIEASQGDDVAADPGPESRASFDIVRVISDQPAAAGLALARERGIATRCVPAAAAHGGAAPDRVDHESRLAAAIDEASPALVVLAGFMRILSAQFVERYAGRLLNIHPSLLPRHPGLHTHRRALAAHDHVHGATVHFVTPELDAGPRIIQATVQIRPGDDAATVEARVLAVEHRIYPLAVQWFCAGRLECRDGCAWLDGRALLTPLHYAPPTPARAD